MIRLNYDIIFIVQSRISSIAKKKIKTCDILSLDVAELDDA